MEYMEVGEIKEVNGVRLKCCLAEDSTCLGCYFYDDHCLGTDMKCVGKGREDLQCVIYLEV